MEQTENLGGGGTCRCSYAYVSLPDVGWNLMDVGWNLMDPFFNSQKFSTARCRCLHGVTSSRISDSPCQWLPIHSLLCGNQWQTECLPLNSVPAKAKHQMSGSSLKCCMMFMVLCTSWSTIYLWPISYNVHDPAATLYSSNDHFLAQISYSDS